MLLTIYLKGTLLDGTPYSVNIKVHDYEDVAIWTVDDKLINSTSSSDMIKVIKMVPSWMKDVYWEGVDNPGLWAAAGCTPDEARIQLSLPDGYPGKFSVEALDTLVALRGDSL